MGKVGYFYIFLKSSHLLLLLTVIHTPFARVRGTYSSFSFSPYSYYLPLSSLIHSHTISAHNTPLPFSNTFQRSKSHEGLKDSQGNSLYRSACACRKKQFHLVIIFQGLRDTERDYECCQHKESESNKGK